MPGRVPLFVAMSMALSISDALVTWLAFSVTSDIDPPMGTLPSVNSIVMERSMAIFFMVPSEELSAAGFQPTAKDKLVVRRQE